MARCWAENCNKELKHWNKSGVCSLHWNLVRSRKDEEYYLKNKEKISTYQKQWRENNKEYLKKYHEKWIKKPENRISNNLRNRLRKYVLRAIKSGKAPVGGAIFGHTGLNWIELKNYFESMFYPHPVTGESMNWDNMGKKWHIDHIKPLCSFDFNKPESAKLANHYLNLRPLWAEDNSAKIKADRKVSHRIQKS